MTCAISTKKLRFVKIPRRLTPACLCEVRGKIILEIRSAEPRKQGLFLVAPDYAAVNLPVFTVSAREYLRHAGQLKQDGKATSFSDVNDTEIPKLQEYCHHLTLPHRERRAKRFLELLRNFVSGVQVYVDNIAMYV